MAVTAPDTAYSLWREGGAVDAPFIVAAMFTPSYRPMAERLLASLTRFELAHALFEVPQVHRSISAKGEGDLSVSKPRFIRYLLERFQKPLLYVDADVVFRRPPRQIATLVKKGCDFAIYNWLADAMNDAWRPEPGTPLWKFYFSVDLASNSQLMASGAVQYWRGGAAAMTLLSDWEQSLRNHPLSEDDHCLDFAYNHGDRAGLKASWLTKSCCRYAFWPYVQPVIDHPQFPAPASGHYQQLGSERFDRARLARAEKEQPFPRDAVLDAKSKQLLRPGPEGLAPAGPLPRRLYLRHD
jgi:Nucleotide-diphospho-sugar transferase